MAAKGSVVARILSEYDAKGTRAARKDLEVLQKNFHDFGKKAVEAFALAGAAGIAFAASSVKLAMEDQKSQAILANVLKNTTGANDAAIKSAEKYINATQLRLGINDNELRPSLQALITATRDVTKAESLQQLAMDISAGRGKDLGAVSIALAKAYDGNFSALKRLGIPLSETLIKSKDFVGITKELSAAVSGSAAVAADTLAGRMDRVKLSFEEAQKSLGYALLPALQSFLDVLINQVLPNLQKFIDQNKAQLAKALQNSAVFLGNLIKKAVEFGTWMGSHLAIMKEVAVVIAAMWAYGKIVAFVTEVAKVVTIMKALAAAAKTAAVFEALATGGATLAAGIAALAILGIGTAWATSGDEAKKAGDKFSAAGYKWKFGSTVTPTTKKVISGMPADTNLTDSWSGKVAIAAEAKLLAAAKARAAINAQIAKDANAAAAAAAKSARQAQLDAVKEALLVKSLAALKKLGVTPSTETNPIELEAARQNLVKQGNLAELAKIKAMTDALDLQMKTNAAAQKYADIMQALADGTISSQEVAVLAEKWGMSVGQVEEYIARIYAAGSTAINNDAILKLYESWGMTKEEAQRYIDFAKALADEKLSDVEIANLAAKWGMSRDQVVAYAKKVQDGTVFSGTFSQPGNDATASWVNALAALNAYLAAVRAGAGVVVGGGGSTGTNPPVYAPGAANPATPTLLNPAGGAKDLSNYAVGVSSFGITPSVTSINSINGADRNGVGGTTVTVNVAGSVVTKGDLVAAITAGIQQNQISGTPIVLSSIGGL
jgi:hypothetical protein